ncbi:glycosyltransferase [Clostridium beijerinckii]|uniref:TPR domain-containing glycosyltransferase n=1 Tax=Clostridium beijerinckii TaxID=1520 RepID=UPI00222796A3|nr:TPR domain-containing glycosyltransferase [Clostridium beijerinckii]UYZ34249.1 glycosyltransferase [Clostridium beijerinckii]
MLSLCMIVKNEEEYLEKCLLSAKNIVDEIVIVDTGSTDGTKEIAYKFTSKVYDFEWCNDFSKARNFSISKAINDYILILDADEVICDYQYNDIKNFCSKVNNKVVGRLKRVNEYEDNHGTRKYIERVNRIFNRNYFEYEGIIHEQVVSKDKEDYSTKNINLVLNHVGYSKEVLNRTNKIERNIELLKEALKVNSKDPYIHYQLGKSYFMGKVYKEAYTSFREAVTLIDNYNYEYAEDLIESYGYTLINLNLFKEALKILEFEKYYKKLPDFLFLLGIIYMNNGKFKEAVETFLRCTEYEEGKIEGITTFLPFYNAGVIYECLGLNEEAVKYYKLCGDYTPAKLRIKG